MPGSWATRIYLCLHVCACISLRVSCAFKYLWKPKEGVRSAGAGVTGGCELSDGSVGNQTQTFFQEHQAHLTAEPSL